MNRGQYHLALGDESTEPEAPLASCAETARSHPYFPYPKDALTRFGFVVGDLLR